MHKEISFIIPSRNTIDYTKIAYSSIRRYYPTFEIVILDESDADNTWEWLQETGKTDPNLTLWKNPGKMLGHCVTYDIGIKMCRNPIFSIFHSDMVCGEGYVENLLKHWRAGRVISATRMEPQGIYPPGKEKILLPMSPVVESFNIDEFDRYAKQEQITSKDKTTRGIFAPWLMSKEDFLVIGGHDHTRFAPWPTEDSDAFLRFALAGYELIQSRDSLCFHFISKGHRNWAKNGVGKDDPEFRFYQTRSIRNYIRKWNRMFAYDEYAYPIVHPVYDLGFMVKAKSVDFLHAIEPWAQRVYVIDNNPLIDTYLSKEQPTTNVDLSKRVMSDLSEYAIYDDILVEFSQEDFEKNLNDSMFILQHLNQIITESVEEGKMELGIFKLTCRRKLDISKNLIKVNNPSQ
jgi:glycosyltransferase involved in cell wall biosynthesis